ncbi:MAG TPA: anti-sigma factor [Mesorhizobium sp.]
MTALETNGPEHEGDDLLAAEYVLGVLTADERLAAQRRAEADTAFARLVDAWEVRLSPLDGGYAEVEAPASVKAALDRRLFTPTSAGAARPGLWSSLAFWRGLTMAALAALALYVAAPLVNPPVPSSQPTLVAALAADGSDVKYLAVYDPAQHSVGLSHVAGEHATGKDFELWMIEGKNPPVSMGIIAAGATARLPVSPAVQQRLAQGAVLAVSLEPAGGSPTGQPTGPVVAAGDLKNI